MKSNTRGRFTHLFCTLLKQLNIGTLDRESEKIRPLVQLASQTWLQSTSQVHFQVKAVQFLFHFSKHCIRAVVL